ncbi:MAG: DUF2207 domain-containing protein [Chitinophagaceae bacterium]|nr:DUF2207 domain-containing protein [Chitinophagaceae bacterium]
MKASFITMLMLLFGSLHIHAQEAFYVKDYDVDVQVTQDASLKITEKISVYFTESRHGIIRYIPYRYKVEDLPEGLEKAEAAWEYNGYRYVNIKDVKVRYAKYKVSSTGDNQTIRIGDENRLVTRDQYYEISYTMEGAVNFFKDYSELYLNVIGNAWATRIEKVHFTIRFPAPLPDSVRWFVATGRRGSTDNNSYTKWNDDHTVLEGMTIAPLKMYEGVTVGVAMPGGMIKKPDYSKRDLGWLALPFITLFGMFGIWRRWGKDPAVTVVAQFYPPDGITPSVAGSLIDGTVNRRDLTALVPYWGAKGYIRVEETEKKKLLGLIKGYEYKFIKLKELDNNAERFERTMFSDMFAEGDEVVLDDLKDSYYRTMEASRKQLKELIDSRKYYTQYSREFAVLIPVFGILFLIIGIVTFIGHYPVGAIKWGAILTASLIVVVFGALMSKKTEKGTEVYEKLLGFKEFIKTVEKDKLNEFLKEDPNYFDKILPYAIVFNVADEWKDKLKDLDVPPPSWYSSTNYTAANFSNLMFLNSLDRSMNSMSQTFYSRPSSSGSSGGSFGGGGFSGGGFGGGGGGSW